MMKAPEFKKTDIKDIVIPHSVSVDPQSGAASIQVQVPLTPGRSGFHPDLYLSYQSGGRNSPFGIGWTLTGVPSISLYLKNGYPDYAKDLKYAFGSQELVPLLEKQSAGWLPKKSDSSTHSIYYFRPAVDPTFLRFEKWVDKTNMDVHWRMWNKNNQLMIFGAAPLGASRISDPENPDHIFQWLVESEYDNLGNVVQFEYVRETQDNIARTASYEQPRIRTGSGLAQKYLKRVRYGNRIPVYPDQAEPSGQQWLFEIVMDYGEQGNTAATAYTSTNTWPARPDPFSIYSPGFELRTYRLCRRILQFHNIAELGDGPTLIGNLAFHYTEMPDRETTLHDITYSGYTRNAQSSVYSEKQVPPLVFEYSAAVIDTVFQSATVGSVENAPIGIGGMSYKWVDLYGEGIPGILFETNESWYYKPNLGNGELGPQERVLHKPSAPIGAYTFGDFDGDGNPDLVVMHGREAGYYSYDRDQEVWSGYHAFAGTPQIADLGVHSQMIDITGDGLADLITVEQDRIIWFPAKGRDGFDAPVQIAKPVSNGTSHAAVIGFDPSLDYFLADMTGDGLPDQVRVQNGRVEYWPNLGYGRWGEGIVMENAPVLANGFELDASRIRLTDLTGTGTADLIYFGKGEISYWLNIGGNTFLPAKTIGGLPVIDQFASMQIVDFLVTGSPCLVWSTSLQQGQGPLNYLELNQGTRPNMLLKMQNSMGQQVELVYGFSGRHYLRDKLTDTPWITRLPNHSTVVDEMITTDAIGNTSFRQRFEYHDGSYDGEDRAFKGFGLVDQYDSDVYDGTSGIPATEFTDPVCIRTWYHNGVSGYEKQRSSNYYSGLSAVFSDYKIESADALKEEEYLQAIRSLAGQMIRTETYGLDQKGQRAAVPFTIHAGRFLVRCLQPSTDTDDAAFAVFSIEQLQYTFDQMPAYPRILHTLNLHIDPYGSSTHVLKLGYAGTDPAALPEQKTAILQLGVISVKHFDEPDHYALGIPLEEKQFELHGLVPAGGSLFSYEELVSAADVLLSSPPLSFEMAFTTGPQARLMQWVKHYYWDETRTTALASGTTTDRPMLHHTETACFNNAFLNDALGARLAPSMPNANGYLFHDDLWWHKGDVSHFAPDNAFNLLQSETHVDNSSHVYTYDAYSLQLTGVTDPVGNSITADLDYHFLAPHQITDANKNVSQVRYDPLGIITHSSEQGDILGDSAAVVKYGNDLLENYVDRSGFTFDDIINDPARFVQGISTFIYYELDNWQLNSQPLRSVLVTRENWLNPGTGVRQETSGSQVVIKYHDGFGRSLQDKRLVDPGAAISRDGAGKVVVADGEPVLADVSRRWLVSGHTVYNNKQEVVRQFEPYFSGTEAFESDEVLEKFGQSALTFYDALGRAIRAEYADGTVTKIEMTPWLSRKFDQIDAVGGSLYELEREALTDPTDPERQALAKSQVHMNTPLISYVDPIERAFRKEEKNFDGQIKSSLVELDFLGNPVRITDARSIVAFTCKRDMLGRAFFEHSIDAGDKWQFPGTTNKVIHLWDGRNFHQSFEYDPMGRVTSIHVDGPGISLMTERLTYGESLDPTDASNRNQRGQFVEHDNPSGVTRAMRYNLTGALLDKEQQVVADYKNIADWTNPANVGLLPDTYATHMVFDALGRMTQSRLPDGTVRKYIYQQGGETKQVLLTTGDGILTDQPIVKAVAYNARGQQTQVVLGNAVVKDFYYDPYSYRLSRLASHLPSGSDPGRLYQDIRYTYDAGGNLVFVNDLAQGPGASFITGLPVSPLKEFTYDSFYQLTEAKGRTHQLLDERDYAHAPEAPGFIKGTRHITLNNGASIRRYRRTYQYDLTGNILQMQHSSEALSNETPVTWQRNYWVSGMSNRSLPDVEFSGNPIADPESKFDASGNCLYLPNLRSFEWNYLGQLQNAVVIQREGQPNDAEYYVYGIGAQRVRKVTERLVSGQIEATEKIYVDGCEIVRIRMGDNLLLNRTTSHLTYGEQSVGMLHQWTVDTGGRETTDISAKKMHYQLCENLNAASLELDASAGIISYEEFFPFGDSAYMAGDQWLDIVVKDYRYSGKEQDDFTGLYYYGHRYYVCWMGRWLSPDPIGHADGLNLYQFVHNSPENHEDEDGLQTKPVPQTQRPAAAGNSTSAPLTFPNTAVITESGGDSYQKTFNTAQEFWNFIGEWKKTHTNVVGGKNVPGHVTITTPTVDAKPDPPPSKIEVPETVIKGGEADDDDDDKGGITINGSPADGAGADAGAGSVAGGPGSGDGRAGSGNGSGMAPANGVGAGTVPGNGTGGPGGGGTVASGGVGQGVTPGGGGPGGNGANGGSNGPGGNGAGAGLNIGPGGAPRNRAGGESMRGARAGGTGTHPLDPGAPYDMHGDPNAQPGGQGNVPGAGMEGGDPNGDPHGSAHGSPGGTGTGQPPEELEWWQTALIVAAVVVVAVVLTIATAGLATAVFGAAAASSLGGMLAIGAVGGFAAGFAGDLTSQSMTLAFQGKPVAANLNWGHALQQGVVGAAVGVLTAGAGAALSSAAKGSIEAAAVARTAGSATLSERALLSADSAFNNSAAFRAFVRGGKGALMGGFGGSASEAGSQILRDGHISNGTAVLTAGAQGMAFGAVLDAGMGHVADRVQASATPRGTPASEETSAAAPSPGSSAPPPESPSSSGSSPSGSSPAPRPRPLARQYGGDVGESGFGPKGSGGTDRVTARTNAEGTRMLDAVTGELKKEHLSMKGSGTTEASRGAAQAEHSEYINGRQGNVFQAGHARDNRFGGLGGLINTFPQWAHMNTGQFNQFVGRVALLVESSSSTDRIFFSVQPRYASATATAPSQVTYFLRVNGRTVIRAIFSNTPGRKYVRFF